jgi:hypothetical protein
VKGQLELHNLRTHHLTRSSELKYLIRGKVVILKCQVFGGKTGQFPMGPVFCVVRPVATVWFRVEPGQKPIREFEPIANSSSACPEVLNRRHDQKYITSADKAQLHIPYQARRTR